ncbi:Superfamily II DNA and RNA helicase [Candidatus Burkholderia pumila]|uniref:Superfamily II DNA and RNA helicase n=1 Tax=Candidatus Burkholderia pumila TaxID=1090375 RepID=A0ABR5HK41_9BURK|nr:Superfamily II DNA and RNA helicase [Candidatus Burkholderia pumila]
MSDKPAQNVLNEEPIDDEIAQVLRRVDYPVNKDALVDTARNAGVSNDVVILFDGLPKQDYDDADSVEQLLGSNGGPGIAV